ncbi:two-component system sensor kinase [[Actinomadura] parvosata subsp. kistnae]|nr:two-component system sensor kinase [Actinomadura parvosata subsp. kistnae]
MPYMMVGVLVAGLARGESANLLLPVQVGVFAAVLPVVAVTGLFLPVRGLSVNAAQGLLGARVETPPRQAGRSWQERRRTAAWFTLHLAVGGVVSGFTLAVVPFTMFTLVLPFTGQSTPVLGLPVTPGWNAIGWAVAGLVLLAALVAMAAGAGELLARLAPVLLGPTPAERLAAAEEHARTLAERNRLARELHDSVGHALSVVTLQAAAAAGSSTATPPRPGRRWPPSSSRPAPPWRTSTTCWASCATTAPDRAAGPRRRGRWRTSTSSSPPPVPGCCARWATCPGCPPSSRARRTASCRRR